MSELIGRELVEAIDQLIITRVAEFAYHSDHRPDLIRVHKDDAELIKRKITDALLAMYARKGIYVSGELIHTPISYTKR